MEASPTANQARRPGDAATTNAEDGRQELTRYDPACESSVRRKQNWVFTLIGLGIALAVTVEEFIDSRKLRSVRVDSEIVNVDLDARTITAVAYLPGHDEPHTFTASVPMDCKILKGEERVELTDLGPEQRIIGKGHIHPDGRIVAEKIRLAEFMKNLPAGMP